VLRRLTLGVILLLAGVPSASADLVLQADPPSATTSGGVTTTTINIRLDNATDLASYNVEFALELPGIDFSGLSITQPNPPGVTITIAAATTNAIFPLTGNFFAQLNYAPGDPTNCPTPAAIPLVASPSCRPHSNPPPWSPSPR
jgi:hypothetical protein